MTTAHPSDPIAPSYADLLAQNAQLQQEKQQLQQQIDEQRQQYEAELARINQARVEGIAKQQRLIHRLFGQKSEALMPKKDNRN